MPSIEVQSEITGMVWKILVEKDAAVSEDEPLMILESMKMEIPLLCPADGTVQEIRVVEGHPISEGDVAVIIAA